MSTNNTTESPDYVTYDEFNSDYIHGSKPDAKQIPNSQPPATYHAINLQYNKGNNDRPIFKDFEMEFCEFDTTGIISKSSNIPGKMDESILIRFDARNEKHVKCMESILGVYKKCGEILHM